MAMMAITRAALPAVGAVLTGMGEDGAKAHRCDGDKFTPSHAGAKDLGPLPALVAEPAHFAVQPGLFG